MADVKQEIEYLAIIPARGGSKRLPGKNIKKLNDKPLIAYSIEAALGAKKISRAIVSTDDAQIAEVAKQYGADLPFIRPADLATDTAGVTDTLRHAVEFYLAQGITVKNVVLLQVTSPFRTASHIDAAINYFEQHKDVDLLTSVSPAKNHPYYALKGNSVELQPFFDTEKLAMRAFELPSASYENGVIFIINSESLMKNGIYGRNNIVFNMDEAELCVDIDTEFDFKFAEFLMKHRQAQ